jgi:hypothetical protein
VRIYQLERQRRAEERSRIASPLRVVCSTEPPLGVAVASLGKLKTLLTANKLDPYTKPKEMARSLGFGQPIVKVINLCTVI